MNNQENINNCTYKESVALSLLQEILGKHTEQDHNLMCQLSTKKRCKYIIDLYKVCLNATSYNTTENIPDLQNFND